MSTDVAHIPVALNRCLDLLSPAITNKEKPFLIDATLGLAGHAKLFLEKFDNLHLIGIDRDQSALEIAKNELKKYLDRSTLENTTYDQIEAVMAQAGVTKVDAVLFDLGVSSMQLDLAERGFSYSQDAPLDMRMDRTQSLTAAEIINTYEPGQLVRILRTYGEEKFATRIVESIVKQRAIAPMNSTAQLASLVKEAIPAATRRTGGNPAKRTFQALRIETNDELGTITRALPAALELLNVGARLVVMSFQSLEDRIVKQLFVASTTSGTPRDLPFDLPEFAAKFSMITRGSETPTDAELEENSRSQSVRLRAIERVAA